MAKKSRHLGSKSFWNKLRFRYKISILNEKTLEENFSLRLSPLSGILFFAALFVFIVVLTSTLIIQTPIKNFLPGYLDINMRQDIIRNVFTIDSLQQKLQRQELFLAGIKDIIRGNIQSDTITTADTLAIIVDNIALEKSKEEAAFGKQYEEDEKYNLATVAYNGSESNVIFFRPCRGTVVNHFNEATKNYSVKINVTPSSPVSSVMDGTVIYVDLTLNSGYTVHIQHHSNYTSVYQNIASLTHNTGDTVRSGEVIGFTRKAETETFILFGLWSNGKAVNPERYIQFRE
ncbi:MAG: murein hydrolase activator EnvC family protein [Bacteroidales bacterium]